MNTLGIDLAQANAIAHAVILGGMVVLFYRVGAAERRLKENGIVKKRRK